jgi:hypothetical protein
MHFTRRQYLLLRASVVNQIRMLESNVLADPSDTDLRSILDLAREVLAILEAD